MADVAKHDPGPSTRSAATWRGRPPGLAFHLVLALPTLVLLAAVTVPGTRFLLLIAALWALAVGAVVWLVRLVGWARSSQRDGARRSGWPFLVAPVVGVLVALLVWVDAPLEARWAFARDDFESVIESIPSPDGSTASADLAVPGRIGTYRISEAYRLAGGVAFTVRGAGGIMQEGGFAHLPSGPPDASGATGGGRFESMQFHPLGGDWYAWVATL